MGADLYIMKVYNKTKKKYDPLFKAACARRDEIAKFVGPKCLEDREYQDAQKEVQKYLNLVCGEGYFRDSYNASGVAQSLGFSWWADVIPLLNKQRNLSGKNLKKFLKMVSVEPKKLTAYQIKRYGGRVDDKDNSVQAWQESYKVRQEELIAFVKQAIKLRAPIHCSL